MSNGTIAVRDQLADLKKQIDARQMVIARSLPPGLSQARFEQSIITLCGRVPELLRCDRASFIGAVLRAAHLGLDVDPATGQAWILPFGKVAQFIPGYRGLAQLAWRTETVSKLGGEAVREGDFFDWMDGSDAFIKHKRLAPETAAVTHAWSLFKVKGSDEATFRVIPVDEIEKIRKAAPSARARTSPWTTGHYAEMSVKTAHRRCLKLVPSNGEKSRPLEKAIDLDERADRGAKQYNVEELLDEVSNEKETEQEAGQDGGGAAGQVPHSEAGSDR